MAEEQFVWAAKSEGHLVTRKAGGGEREQAEQLRNDAPIRTRIARLMRVHTDERAHRLGAIGEETVGARLAKLDPTQWLVLHDIVLNKRGTNLDHLVIGPGGVYSLNTKHRPKAKIVVTEQTFRVNGYRESYLPASVSEASKVSRILSREMGHPVQVRPVIVIMGAELEVRKAPPDVDVIRRRDLPKWFKRQDQVLSRLEAMQVMQVAGRPATWKPSR